MWLPSSLGNYDRLLQALLHDPFIGGGGSGHFPVTHHHHSAEALQARYSPEPSPWLRGPSPEPWAVSFLVSAVASKASARAMNNRDAAAQIETAADSAISQFIDDYCGTPPRRFPWPYPGPPWWVWEIASQLTMAANAFQEGAMREGLTQVAGRILEKVALNPQPLPPKAASAKGD